MKRTAIAMVVAVVAFLLLLADVASAQCLGGKCGTKTVTRSRTVTHGNGPVYGIYAAPRLAYSPGTAVSPPAAEQVPTPAPTPATAAPATAPATAAPATTTAPARKSKSVIKSRTKTRTAPPVYLQPVWCGPPPMVWVPVYPCCPF